MQTSMMIEALLESVQQLQRSLADIEKDLREHLAIESHRLTTDQLRELLEDDNGDDRGS